MERSALGSAGTRQEQGTQTHLLVGLSRRSAPSLVFLRLLCCFSATPREWRAEASPCAAVCSADRTGPVHLVNQPTLRGAWEQRERSKRANILSLSWHIVPPPLPVLPPPHDPLSDHMLTDKEINMEGTSAQYSPAMILFMYRSRFLKANRLRSFFYFPAFLSLRSLSPGELLRAKSRERSENRLLGSFSH